MWQRIQSVFIGLSIVCLIVALLQPVWESLDGQTRLYPIYLMQKMKTEQGESLKEIYIPFCLTAVLIVAALTIAVQEFRRYDNRLLQIKLGALNSLIIALIIICIVWFSNMVIKESPTVNWRYGLSLYLSFAATAFNWIAMRFIRKDEKTVRDSDRLR
jgi:glucan phosphoethanolaminetransferase (alkaline phosphatase superfamily)